jgi:multiple sugar transport system substrate-binding protein
MMKFDRKHIYGAQNGSLCSMQLYYNRTIFDKAHLAYPNTRWTWSDFLTTARKLTVRQGGKTVQWGADWGYLLGWDGGWQTLAASFGAKIMKTNFNPRKLYLNDPATIKAWQFMHDLVYKYKVAPTPAVDKALGQGGASPFQTGRIAMVPDGCWQLATYKTSVKLGMTLLPRGPVARVNPVWYAGGFMIPASSPNKPLAWEWLRWLAADKTANELMAKAGLNCGAPLVKTYDKLFSAAWATVPGGNACVKSLNHARYFQIYAPNLQQIFDNVINPNWDKFQHGKISARELAATLDREVNTALQSGGTMATSR